MALYHHININIASCQCRQHQLSCPAHQACHLIQRPNDLHAVGHAVHVGPENEALRLAQERRRFRVPLACRVLTLWGAAATCGEGERQLWQAGLW